MGGLEMSDYVNLQDLRSFLEMLEERDRKGQRRGLSYYTDKNSEQIMAEVRSLAGASEEVRSLVLSRFLRIDGALAFQAWLEQREAAA